MVILKYLILRHQINNKQKMDSKFKVLLISPTIPNNRHYSYYPPVSLGIIGTVLKEKKDCAVKIIDVNARYKIYQVADLARIAKDYQPDFIGLTLMTPHVLMGYKIIKELSQAKIPIVVGGYHATFFPEEVLEHGATLVVRGEGESTIQEVVEHFQGKKLRKDIKGISFVSPSGEVINNQSQDFVMDLDSLPIMDRSIFDYDAYIKDKNDLRAFGLMNTSRSCPGRCLYCSRYDRGIRFRFNSADRVYREMKHLNEAYGVTYFNFQDDAFTVNKPRIKDLMNLLIKDSKLSSKWICMTRPDCIDLELLKMMKAGGCTMIIYGFETGDAESLKIIRKNVNIKRMNEVVNITNQAGIRCQLNFMVGFPWETKSHIRNTTKFITKVKSNVFRISTGGLLTPFPGSDIYGMYHQKYGFTKWWLNEKLPAWNNKEDPPLFQDQRMMVFMPCEQQLEINFFKYSKSIKREIRRFYRIAGNTVYNDYRHFPRLPVFVFFYYLSRFLYWVNPKAERKITFPLFDFTKRIWGAKKKEVF